MKRAFGIIPICMLLLCFKVSFWRYFSWHGVTVTFRPCHVSLLISQDNSNTTWGVFR